MSYGDSGTFGVFVPSAHGGLCSFLISHRAVTLRGCTGKLTAPLPYPSATACSAMQPLPLSYSLLARCTSPSTSQMIVQSWRILSVVFLEALCNEVGTAIRWPSSYPVVACPSHGYHVVAYPVLAALWHFLLCSLFTILSLLASRAARALGYIHGFSPVHIPAGCSEAAPFHSIHPFFETLAQLSSMLSLSLSLSTVKRPGLASLCALSLSLFVCLPFGWTGQRRIPPLRSCGVPPVPCRADICSPSDLQKGISWRIASSCSLCGRPHEIFEVSFCSVALQAACVWWVLSLFALISGAFSLCLHQLFVFCCAIAMSHVTQPNDCEHHVWMFVCFAAKLKILEYKVTHTSFSMAVEGRVERCLCHPVTLNGCPSA